MITSRLSKGPTSGRACLHSLISYLLFLRRWISLRKMASNYRQDNLPEMAHIPIRYHGAASAYSSTFSGFMMDVEHQNIVQNDVPFETPVLTFPYLSDGDLKLSHFDLFCTQESKAEAFKGESPSACTFRCHYHETHCRL